MANITEFKSYTSDPRSFLFDNYLTNVPDQPEAQQPDESIVITAAGQVTIAGGIILARFGAVGTRVLSIPFRDIVPGSVRGAVSTTAVAKVVEVSALDYDLGNTDGVNSIHIQHFDRTMQSPVFQDVVMISPPAALQTKPQRATAMAARINDDPNSLYVAASPASSIKVVLTEKVAGRDSQVTAGTGFGLQATTTAAVREVLTGPHLRKLGVDAPESAFAVGKTYKAITFIYEQRATIASAGLFVGRTVENNTTALRRSSAMLLFELPAGYDAAQVILNGGGNEYIAVAPALITLV